MPDFLMQKFKNNNYFFSFFLPTIIFFPFLFSYVFFTPKKTVFLDGGIQRDRAVSLEEEISIIEDAAKVGDLREIKNIIKNEEKSQETDTSSKTDEIKDIINTKSTIKILMFGYHQIRETRSSDGPKTRMFITSPEIFDKEMKFLFDKGYHTISTTEYINYLKTGKAEFDLNKSFILTFDDGYASQYTNAFPVLKKYGFTATFFIYTDCIDKYPACMTSQEIKDLAANGMKIANHTFHHAYLPRYNDKAIINEIEINKQKLINMVGTSSFENIFAYPYGGTDSRVENIVRSLGYDGASGIIASKKEKDRNLFNLKRYLLGEDIDYFESLFK